MTKTPDGKPASDLAGTRNLKPQKSASRDDRLAQQLRANLKRRKDATKRKSEAPDTAG